ncbi:hypothetical protein B4O97_14330 [Marispirochaeta aestuarii]|uniref:ABC transporter domain-containing protein n=1 Tax=Marispirochaeta aestuarii TaxID=1963862 RepID=A0A1Y1RVM6_9SPIO|nr:ABC transporter ATP-binding protein [Marispirochaeta aestuarii]ORC34058.1 hypothetical protein B4O97_14330 [Marispirochaeta aestuarii]
MNAAKCIEAEAISKRYGEIRALEGVDIHAAAGEITGLIGPDGAGKSSFMRIVLGLLESDGGELKLFGETPERGRRGGIGYMPEVFSLYTDLTVEENMRFSFRIHGGRPAEYTARSERLYTFNRLSDFKAARAGTLSGGMKQKLALSCALMQEPRLLVLDEPTTGVDPLSRREFWRMLSELKREGIGILVSTPYMEEALQCDRIYLMNEGRILNAGAPRELIDGFDGRIIEFEDSELAPQDLRRELAAAWSGRPVYLSGRSVHLVLPAAAGDAAADLPTRSSGTSREIEPDLEDIFLAGILR